MMSEKTVDRIIPLVNALELDRSIPQFLFISAINQKSTSLVREAVDLYKKNHKDIKEIDVILESPGGSADWAYKLIRTFRESFPVVNIVVPYWAKSAATLFALGGSKIIMNEFGELGPLDTQLIVDDYEKADMETQSALVDEQSLQTIEAHAVSLYHKMYGLSTKNKSRKIGMNRTVLSQQLLDFVAHFYQPLLSKIDPYSIGQKKRYLAVGEAYATRILIKYSDIDRDDIKDFVDYLVNGCPDHGFAIDHGILSLFLKNAEKSSAIGKNYDEHLTKISKIFVRENVEDYVGFIEKEQHESPKQQKAQRPADKQSRGSDKKSNKRSRKRSKWDRSVRWEASIWNFRKKQ